MFPFTTFSLDKYDPLRKCLLHGQKYLALRPETNKGANIAVDYFMFPWEEVLRGADATCGDVSPRQVQPVRL